MKSRETIENKISRNGSIDIGAGIMVIWLLYYHALYPLLGENILREIPWFFYFMPWFFYKSGFFFKPKSLKEIINKDAKKLLKQFAIWSAIGYMCYILHHVLYYNDVALRMAFYTPLRSLILSGSIPINSALWFLLTLFLVRQIANVIFPKCNAIIICGVSMIAACAIHFINHPFMPFTLYSIAWGLCFFSAGNYLKKYEQNRWVIAVSFVMLLLTFTLTDVAEVYKKEDTIVWYWYVLWYPASIAGCVVFNNICRWIDDLGKVVFKESRHDMPLPVFKWVGRHSMTFYVAHYIIFRITFDWVARYNDSWYSGWQGVVIITLAYVIIIVPLCFVLDKKKV